MILGAGVLLFLNRMAQAFESADPRRAPAAGAVQDETGDALAAARKRSEEEDRDAESASDGAA